MKRWIAFFLATIMLFTLCACGTSVTETDEVKERTITAESQETTTVVTEEVKGDAAEEPAEVKYEPFNVGNTVTSDDWEIKLTRAYTSDTLESSESRTSWTANDGYAFLILEFDIKCLNSTKPTVDGEGITDLVATVDGNTYEGWTYQYVNSEIWCYINNTYLDANLPLHIYVYSYIPESSMNNRVGVNLMVAGQPKVININ